MRSYMEASKSSSTSTTAIVPSPYRRILVPREGSEMSDRALNHALYVAKMANAEMVIFHVMESDIIPTSTSLAFIKPDAGLAEAREEVRTIFEGAVGLMLEERVQAAKASGINSVSYKISSGKPADAIVIESEASEYDLIVMASSRITSSIRALGSTARRVLDSTRKPVVLVHE
jgi:nucleotide-binding universal stress UspA family protein